MSNVTALRGAIHTEAAYAQGKMLDNSSWNLPRKITPSDFDCVFDNGGRLVLAEFSSSCSEWGELKYGQRLAYESAIKGTHNLAALCKHGVPPDRQINTRNDVDSFQVMFCVAGDLVLSPLFDGNRWGRFIESWFSSPYRVVAGLIEARRLQDIGMA